MGFFELDGVWKIWVYRFGLFFCCFSILGLILVGINVIKNRGKDILKRKDKPKFNGGIEKFFYLYGFIIPMLMILFSFMG